LATIYTQPFPLPRYCGISVALAAKKMLAQWKSSGL